MAALEAEKDLEDSCFPKLSEHASTYHRTGCAEAFKSPCTDLSRRTTLVHCIWADSMALSDDWLLSSVDDL